MIQAGVEAVNKRQRSRFILWGRWFHRKDVVESMEVFQDLIVMLLCVSLFCTMAIQLFGMFSALLHQVDFKRVTADILFLLILVELFRLLIIYLEEHSISVGVAVEVTIVSVLREVIVHGALEISWVQILSICGLLFILGALLMVCARTPHMDHFSYPLPGMPFPQSPLHQSPHQSPSHQSSKDLYAPNTEPEH